MKGCPETRRVQDYLDRTLEPREAAAFGAHLEGCATCAVELALYRRVFTALDATPAPIALPGLTERVLARVLPSRVRLRRRLVALGWSYGASLAAVLVAVGAWTTRPDARQALEALSSEATRRVLQTGIFVLNALTHGTLRFVEGSRLLAAAGERLSPVQRALGTLLSQPSVALTAWAALLVCAAVLWWIRPRSAPGEVRRVGMLLV